VIRRGPWLWWRALGAFILGVTISATYGVIQTVTRFSTGVELDSILIAPLFPGARSLGANLYGAVSTYDAFGVTGQTSVYRLTGLAEDPNHLGVMAALPFLVVLALVVGGAASTITRHRTALAILGALLLVAILLTQSRSGLLGVAIGMLMLLLWYRRAFFNRQVLIGGGLIAAAGIFGAASRWSQVSQLLASRLSTDNRSSRAHVELYSLILPVLEQAPLFGLGMNNFAVFYQFQTGRADFGPHSFLVATFTEMGLVGASVWLIFLLWVASRLHVLVRARRIGYASATVDPDTITAVGRGLSAGFVATLAGNIFYLTMIFNAFYITLLIIITAPAVFGVRAAVAGRTARSSRAARAPSAT
jgi:O-antigen ligase